MAACNGLFRTRSSEFLYRKENRAKSSQIDLENGDYMRTSWRGDIYARFFHHRSIFCGTPLARRTIR
jgi:hypothetical protein